MQSLETHGIGVCGYDRGCPPGFGMDFRPFFYDCVRTQKSTFFLCVRTQNLIYINKRMVFHQKNDEKVGGSVKKAVPLHRQTKGTTKQRQENA